MVHWSHQLGFRQVFPGVNDVVPSGDCLTVENAGSSSSQYFPMVIEKRGPAVHQHGWSDDVMLRTSTWKPHGRLATLGLIGLM